jgi:ribosomal protein S18 acetylase RimI-like enzyme
MTSDMNSYRFRMAENGDADVILRLYRSIVGTPGCTWNSEYPGMENILSDIGKASLYCLCDGEGRIIAAAAAGEEDELEHDGIPWDKRMKRPCDLARIGVRPDLQRQGLGKLVLSHVLKDAQRRGFDGMRMLVSKGNPAALALYENAGFRRCGEIFKYDMDFYCYQLPFAEKIQA